MRSVGLPSPDASTAARRRPDQVARCVDAVERRLEGMGKRLETSSVNVVAPGLTDPSLLLLAEILGRSGQLPALLCMRREEGVFVIYGRIELERVKAAARGRRKAQVLP